MRLLGHTDRTVLGMKVTGRTVHMTSSTTVHPEVQNTVIITIDMVAQNQKGEGIVVDQEVQITEGRNTFFCCKF